MIDRQNDMQRKTPSVHPNLKRPGFLDELVRTVIFVVVVTVLFDMAIPRSLVDGRSMQPTFQDGERLIVSRAHYLVLRPQRGDVVVFNSLDAINEPRTMLIKRVLGMPGDTIEFRDQQLFINDTFVPEPYIQEACRSCPNEMWQLGADEYFVMGDNRNHSRDSRAFGPVPLDNIVGHVVFRYWPLPRVGIVGERDYDLPASAPTAQNG